MSNNKTKTFLLLTLIFVTLLGVSAATAATIDNNATDTTSNTQEALTQAIDTVSDNSIPTTTVSNKQINKNTQTNVKTDGEGTFTELTADLSENDVTLTKNYNQGADETNITITSDKTINGNGHTITATNGTFVINEGVTLTLKNLIINAHHGATYQTYYWDLYNNGNLIVNNVTFKYDSPDRTYGGFIWTGTNTNVTITNSVFDGEHTVRSQIYADGSNYNIQISNSKFTNYNASNSAIGLNKAGNLTVNGCNFTDNIITTYGGAIYVNSPDTIVVVDNCLFENLVANYRGGAIYSQGTLIVTNNVFKKLRQANPTYNAGAIYLYTSYGKTPAVISLENNTMEDLTANASDIYIESGKINSTIKVTGENIIADQENPIKIAYNITDDMGNTIGFKTNPFAMTINDQTIPITYVNGTITADTTASFEPGTYPININYDDTNIIQGATITENTLTVNDVGLMHYTDLQAKIDQTEEGDTLVIDGPVYRASNEESILINHDIEIDFKGNFINAKGGKVFDVDNVFSSVFKNLIITNAGNPSTTINNTEGRIFNITNGAYVSLNNVNFTNNIAPNSGSSALGSFILVLGEESGIALNKVNVNNCTGTFINNVGGNVEIIDSLFENNNLYGSYGSRWNSVIANGGSLYVTGSDFINNSVTVSVIDGQSQKLSEEVYGLTTLTSTQELTIEESNFINNTANNNAAAIHTYSDTQISESTFINNYNGHSSNKGGAITSEQGALNIENSIFINNSARYRASYGYVTVTEASAIYNKAGDLNIQNSIILSNVTEVSRIYNDAIDATIEANMNYWGTNDNPEDYVASGTSAEDIIIDNWVIFNVTVPSDYDEIKFKDTIPVEATLNQYTDGTNVHDMETTLPDYGMVTFTSTQGTFNEETSPMQAGIATTQFTVTNTPFTIKAEYPDTEAYYTGEALMPDPELYVLNEGNWTHYFEEDGTIKTEIVIPNSELRFEGNFTNHDMLITIPVNITTADIQARLNNCTFTVTASNVNITKLEMNATNMENSLIVLSDAENVNIEDNNLTLTNNEDQTLTHTIEIYDGSNIKIKNNNITTTGPEDNIQYASDDSIRLLYTTSIYANANNLVLDGNKITTKKNNQTAESMGTIMGIYVYGEDNNNKLSNIEITNNEFLTEGTVYEYGLKVYYAENVLIENNTVTGNGDNFVSGIHVYAITDSTINNNTVNTNSDIGYGIVLEGNMYYDWETEPYMFEEISEYVTVSNNTVNVNSTYAWAIETYGGAYNTIEYNDITVTTSDGVGIGLTDEGSTVSNNYIEVTATMDAGKISSYDYISPDTTGIKITRNNFKDTTDNTVIENTVIVNAPGYMVPAVNVTTIRTTDDTITDNFLVSPYGKGDDAVFVEVPSSAEVTVENNNPSPVILTDETYPMFFDENGVLKEEYDYYDIVAFGEFTENTEFIFDNVHVNFIGADDAKFNNAQFITSNDAQVIFINLAIESEKDVFLLESQNNIIYGTKIKINTLEPVQGIYITGDNNLIAYTILNITGPSTNVEYNDDYSVRTPAPAAITIDSSNNMIDNVGVFFDGTEAIHATTGWDAPTVNGINLISSTTPINNNTFKYTNITVIGSGYAYGINVGNAKNTVIDNIFVDVASENYADAIQLFDADTISINGTAGATAVNQAYGVYSTAMGTGYSQNVNLTGLNVVVNAGDATGALFEGTQNILISDSEYTVYGDSAMVIDAHVDFMGNEPTNITINNVEANVEVVIEETGEDEEELEVPLNDMLYFGQANDITIKNSSFTSNTKSIITFNNITQSAINNVEVTNATITTYELTNLIVDNVTIDNTDLQAVYFESEGNILNNSVITVNSSEPLRVVEFSRNNNSIMNTEITATIPSIDVPYDKDYVGQPLSSGLYISSSDNNVNNVTVDVDGSSAVDNSSYVSIDGIDVQSLGKNYTISNNVLRDVTVSVKGPRYVYGINVGRAKNTTLDNVDIKAESDYYADTLQLFDANDLTVSGKFDSAAGFEAYGVYATAMAVGTSKGITLTDLEVSVEAPKATGVLIEGASDIVIAESGYDLVGENVTAVNAHMDWMYNHPSNILINELDVNIDSTGEANVMYFGAANNITVTDNNIVANKGSHINFNETGNSSVTNNYITVGEMLETGIFGDYAVITTMDDTVIENNTPVSKVIDDLNDKIDELQEKIDELTKPSNTTLTIDPLEDVKYEDTVLISGLVVDADGRAVPGNITLNINGENVTAKADTTGVFTYEYTFTKLGENNISAAYEGTEKFTPSNANTTVTVGKQDTSVIFDDIEAITTGESVTITGQLVDGNGKGFYGTVKLLINTGRATVKTDKEGYFNYTTTLTKVGTNNITGNYLESAKYNAGNGTTTVTVTPLGTGIVFDEIVPTKSGETVTITGKITDDNGNPVVGTIKLLINNGRATVKTDSEGVFTYDYVFTKVGINNITASYLGANRYTESTASTTVEILARDTILTIDNIKDAKKGETITITGKLTDDNGEAVVGTIKLTINGARATVKTDENGIFTYNYTVTKVGTNNITASYLGANRYTASNTSATVKVNKAGTKITLNNIGTVTQKTLVDIKGQLSDEYGNGIYGTVKLLINNGRATVKTDNSGAFTYSYNATRAGENTITANYLESTNYQASENATTTFTVVKA